MMVLPLNALYTALKKYEVENALCLLINYGDQRGADFSTMIEKIILTPGLSSLLWKNIPALMRRTSSPENGYIRRIVSETKEFVGLDIITYLLHEMAKQLEVHVHFIKLRSIIVN